MNRRKKEAGLPERGWVSSLVRKRLDPLPTELHVRLGEANLLHHLIRRFVPLRAEQVRANRLQVVPGLQGAGQQVLAVRLLRLDGSKVQWLGVLLFENEQRQSVVGASLLSYRGLPGQDNLRLSRQLGQVDLGVRGRDGDVDSQVVHLEIESILLNVGNIGVDHGDGDELLAALEELHVKFRCRRADLGVDVFSRLYLAAVEVELGVHDRVAVRKDVGNHLHLRDSLDEDLATVFPPFPIGQVAVDGLAEVT